MDITKELLKALSFYADASRYEGANQRAMPNDPFTPKDFPYRIDVGRDGGEIARAAITKATGGQ